MSELASELATLELSSSSKRSLRLFETSLVDPTENSLAQAEWASRRLPKLELPQLAEVPLADEARARQAAEAGRWEEALVFAQEWLVDQPFDTRAAIFGSYVASVGLEQWDTAIAIADIGLRAKPGDTLLTNNLAFALIEGGQRERAETILSKLSSVADSDEASVALPATRGLLAFRSGDSELGLASYQEAIEVSARTHDVEGEAMARSMLLREQLMGGGVHDLDALASGLRVLLPSVRDPGVIRSVERALGMVQPQGQ